MEKKKVQKWAIDSKEHNKQYILEAGNNVTNFTRKTIFLSLLNVCHQFLKLVHLGGLAQYRFLFLLQPSV